MSLLVIGSVAFDAIETPFGKTDKIIGGAASYISLSASYFVKPINLVAVVGGDFPQEYIDSIRSKGVDTKGLQIKSTEKSFFWSGKYNYDLNSRDTLITELNVLGNFDPIIPDDYQNCEYLMLGNLSPDVQLKVIERLHNRPKLIVLDTMNFWMDIALDSLKQVISKVDVLTINDEEARQLSGEYQLKKAAQKIMLLGPKYLIIKKGEHGAILFHEDRSFYAPALLLDQVFDPTGAGDTFAGGFLGYIAKKDKTDFDTLKKALVYGSAMASFCVEKFGTENLFNLTEQQIEDRFNQFRIMVEF
ncbi:MAG: bifunctional hydroxymethylpyrimidine kinase/phosphomethylpyrimidine kinase [Bacteroidetes bacterium]|nr:bifunctional hydroxymethylpyrimidine kinase/phosphomethylpyrimidine kinase [Bacteroidota bacterium]